MPKVIKKDKFSRPSVNDILLAGRQRSNDISNYNSYTSNDNTQVNNVIKKKYNTNRDKYLEPANKTGGYRALKTTAGKIGTALGAVPIAVAGVPALGASGEVAAPTVTKIAGSLGGKLLGAGLTSAGLANGINDVSKGEYHWYTPLDLAPSVGMGFKAAKNANKTIGNTKTAINEIKKYINNPHIGNYYIKPEYNNLSYIRQVKDDAINDMLRTGKMRSTDAISSIYDDWEEANILLGKKEPDVLNHMIPKNGTMVIPPKFRLNFNKRFSEQMFNTGRPFYGTKERFNYIIKNPSKITKKEDLTNEGLEWIESAHKGHTNAAKNKAIEKGLNPDEAPGRIVVPLYNGDKDIIPIDKMGPFDLYRPVKVGNIDLPFYKRTKFNMKNNRTSYAGGGKVPPAAAPVKLQINPTNLPLPFTNTAPVMPLMKGWELRSKLMKERSIGEYQDWLNKANPQIINAVRKMKNTKEPLTPYLKAWTPEQKETLRREYEIKKANNSDETPYYEYGVKNDLIPGSTCINTSTAAHGEAHPSNVDFAENYKKYGYKRVDVNEMQPGDIIQLSTGGVPIHAMMATSTFDPIYKTFKTSQSHGGHAPSQMEHGKIFTIDPYQAQIRAAREDIKKGKKVDIKSLENDTRELPANIYHYLTPEGIMLYRKIPTNNNNNNTYKFGGDVKSTPKRKHENNYIMKGTGNYVPKTPQEKVVVDLYNANYKSARRNMSREDALRQAHYRTTQQMMESGYGTSKQARKQNNFGGMGGSNSYNYKTINDFTDHVDTTLIKNFKNSYKAPTLKSYINGLYNGRIGAYSETPIEIYDKEFRGTHPRTSKIIEQLNPDDYTTLDNTYNPYGNTNLMYAKYGCKVRPKAWIGAAISAVAGIASSLINANAQKKAAARQARAEEAAENRKYATDLTTQLNNSSADDTQFYDQFKTEFKNGGKVKGYNPRITDGGIAIPIGRDTSLLRGSLHNEINESGNTGIGIKYGNNEVEAQDGEVIRKKKGKLLVYSDEDELGNGISPAKRVLKGENKDKVFAMQETNKRRKGIVNNKSFLIGGHMTFTKGDAYGAAANAAGNLASFFINNNAINKMSAGKAPILVSPTKLNTVYNANAQLADINKSRLRMKNAITRNSSSSVAALGRLNDIENSAIDKINQIYENKNNIESQLMNQDRMNAQSVRLQNAAKIDEYERRVAEMNNQKHLARAQNITSLINGLAGTAEQTINNAEERYYKDKNLELAAAPYDDETMSRFLEIEGAVPENRIVETYLRNKDSQDPKKRALAELAFRRMNNFDESSKYNSYINQEYRNKAKLIGNNGYKVPTLGNINTNIRLNGQTPYYTNPLIARMLNRNNEFISYMNGYRY